VFANKVLKHHRALFIILEKHSIFHNFGELKFVGNFGNGMQSVFGFN
jgi:hypothetical protein